MPDLESAIPPHLRTERTQPTSLPSPNYTPPTAAYVARFPTTTTDLVIATICAQSRTPHQPLDPTTVLAPLLAFLKNSGGSTTANDTSCTPQAYDPIAFTDAASHHTAGIIAYWPSAPAYHAWCASSGFDAWWTALDAARSAVGWFREVFFPRIERYETVFSDGRGPPGEGAGRLAGVAMSGPVREHVYWGSMRDRMAAAQRDALVGERGRKVDEGVVVVAGMGEEATEKRRVRMRGPRNLCVIRSGQDWSGTTPRERRLYLETMHPVLVKGMEFLRDEGEAVGCHCCRFVDVLDLGDGRATATERTFGFAFFEDMAALEGWSKRHKTHLDIFGRFLQYAKELDNDISLRLFHEVLVLTPEQQLLEYVGCHSKTGLIGL